MKKLLTILLALGLFSCEKNLGGEKDQLTFQPLPHLRVI
jgi:hypothetical protein